MDLIIIRTFEAITANNTITQHFFDGSIRAPNYITNQTAQGDLASSLVAYFGQIFGCNQTNFPVYTGPSDMQTLHAPFPIDDAAFKYFNIAIINILSSLGVEVPDQQAALAALDAFRIKICNQADCGNPDSTHLIAPMVTLISFLGAFLLYNF